MNELPDNSWSCSLEGENCTAKWDLWIQNYVIRIKSIDFARIMCLAMEPWQLTVYQNTWLCEPESQINLVFNDTTQKAKIGKNKVKSISRTSFRDEWKHWIFRTEYSMLNETKLAIIILIILVFRLYKNTKTSTTLWRPFPCTTSSSPILKYTIWAHLTISKHS